MVFMAHPCDVVQSTHLTDARVYSVLGMRNQLIVIVAFYKEGLCGVLSHHLFDLKVRQKEDLTKLIPMVFTN